MDAVTRKLMTGTGNFSIAPASLHTSSHTSWKSSLSPFRTNLFALRLSKGILLAMLAFPLNLHAESPAVLEVGRFSAAAEGDRLPDGWKPLTFPKIKRHTIYTLVKENETTVVKAMSEASASGLSREVTINLNKYPVLSWRWKVMNVLNHGDVTKKKGDDSPARLYVTFDFDPARSGFWEKTKFAAYKLIYGRYPPLAAVNYLWESTTPKGTMLPSPYTDRSKIIVVESGPELVNKWVTEERNVLEDYTQVFGAPPPPASGVAIMTDTDNTGESAIAYYGDIVFKQASSQ